MAKKTPMLPLTWDVPKVFRDRLGSTVGKQRLMTADGHLLMVLHAPPAPGQDEREGRFFWRKPDGTWLSDQLGGGTASVSKHLDEFDRLIDELEVQEQQAKVSRDYFEVMAKLAPLHRATGNLYSVLQEARKQLPDAREIIDLRDRAYDIQRSAELLTIGCKNSLDFQMARQAEQQAASSKRMSTAAHRLNMLAAFFFPLATIAGLFGMEVRSGIERLPEPYTFYAIVVIGLAIGAMLMSLLLLSRRSGS
jgi:Mg2+ and Co2+ transporter CorA